MAKKDFNKERTGIIQGLFLIGLVLLLFKAIQIQLIDGTYQDRARTAAIEKVIDFPSRGLIFDRNGKLLVNNNAIYDLQCTYKLVNPNMDTSYFCKLVNITKADFERLINKNFRSARYSKSVPFTFISKLSAATFARFQEAMHEFPGFSIQLRNVRGYPYRNSSHALGYLSEVSQKQLDQPNNTYQKGDFIGSTGLERTYEKDLKGQKGVRYLLKDNLGRPVGSYKEGLQDTAAVSGRDLISTLDVELQTLGEQLLQNKSGSIVAIEPSTGEVLSFISSPTYDPNLLTINRNRGQAYNNLRNDTINKPFLNRAIMAKYPPGSIFKTVVSLVALQVGVMTKNTAVVCNNGYYYGGRVYGCHTHEYPYNLSIALKHSCNTYYFTSIRNIIDKFGFYKPHQGLDLFVSYMDDFGLGIPLGTDIPGEGSGNIPTSAYYDKLYPKIEGSWKSPTIMSIGIGQGEIEMTTIQMANLAAIIANHGYFYTPHLLKGFRDGTAPPDKFRIKHTVPIDKVHFDPVIDGMSKAVKGGTGTIAAIDGIEVCGKTGTSENSHGKDHSVFFAFAPRENPTIAIAVYVEHGIWGNLFAAPMASLMIEQYINGEITDERRIKMINDLSSKDLIHQKQE